jgi:hypothetical protein
LIPLCAGIFRMTMFRTIDTRRRSELDVLHYEIWMLNHLFPDRFTETENRLLLNATLESFLIHARNLISFLEGKSDSQENKDDITCSKFLDSRGRKISKTPVMLPQRLKEKINKHLSHLTITRAQERVDWDCDAIRKSVNYSLGHFFDSVSPDYFPTIQGREKSDFEQLIHPPPHPTAE